MEEVFPDGAGDLFVGPVRMRRRLHAFRPFRGEIPMPQIPQSR
jgi:hypothetical protein